MCSHAGTAAAHVPCFACYRSSVFRNLALSLEVFVSLAWFATRFYFDASVTSTVGILTGSRAAWHQLKNTAPAWHGTLCAADGATWSHLKYAYHSKEEFPENVARQDSCSRGYLDCGVEILILVNVLFAVIINGRPSKCITSSAVCRTDI